VVSVDSCCTALKHASRGANISLSGFQSAGVKFSDLSTVVDINLPAGRRWKEKDEFSSTMICMYSGCINLLRQRFSHKSIDVVYRVIFGW
jgi:hypothetical protein